MSGLPCLHPPLQFLHSLDCSPQSVLKSQWKGTGCALAKVTPGGPPCHMPGAMEGREDEHVAQPRVPGGQGSADHTSLIFSREFGQWEDTGVPLPLE